MQKSTIDFSIETYGTNWFAAHQELFAAVPQTATRETVAAAPYCPRVSQFYIHRQLPANPTVLALDTSADPAI